MANAIQAAAYDNRPGFDWVPIDVSDADVDLTDPSGPTGGWCARALFITSTGTIAFQGTPPPNVELTTRTITVPDNYTINCFVSKVFKTDTSADGIFAIL